MKSNKETGQKTQDQSFGVPVANYVQNINVFFGSEPSQEVAAQ